MRNIKLHLYENEADTAIALIKEFWKEHNNYEMSTEEANEDLKNWSNEEHKLYLIKSGCEYIGFVHLGSRCTLKRLQEMKKQFDYIIGWVMIV